jgi:hypothetical protein
VPSWVTAEPALRSAWPARQAGATRVGARRTETSAKAPA